MFHGTPAVPFAAALPNGSVLDTSSQMGFVGSALPVAALLLRHAITTADEAGQAQAEALVDVWVENSMSESGIPKTWFNTCQPSPADNGGASPNQQRSPTESDDAVAHRPLPCGCAGARPSVLARRLPVHGPPPHHVGRLPGRAQGLAAQEG